MIYFFVGVVIVFLGLIFFVLSVASRKRYRCPQCGEFIQTEYLNASRCNTCGAPLREHY
jgi:predicted RNA-binding Zn-ribbon protein involved in translation (DUF1610 family)